MPEKRFSVKCETNEKNKDIIKHALCNALKIPYSPLDYFSGKEGGAEYKIFISESLDSSGYYVRIVYKEDMPDPSGVMFILPGIAGILLLVVWFWKGIGPWWGLLICEILVFIVLVGVQAGWYKYDEAEVSDKIDSVINALQNETKNVPTPIVQKNQTDHDKEPIMIQQKKSGCISKNIGCMLLIVVAVIGAIIIIPKLQPPISITFRESAINSSRVFQVTNRIMDETLVMKLDVYDSKENHVEHVFKIAPGNTYEIGVLETGCYFEAGDRYSFHADGYVLGIDGTVP